MKKLKACVIASLLVASSFSITSMSQAEGKLSSELYAHNVGWLISQA